MNLHGEPYVGHSAYQEAWKTFKTHYYDWPQAADDLAQHIEECHSCQKTASAPKVILPQSGSLFSLRPFECIHMDTIGPLSKDNMGMKFIYVFIDAFSRLTILSAAPKNNANEAAYALINSVYGHYGLPVAIHCDNGSEFANEVMNELHGLLGISITTSLPYHHQSNGLVERRNRDINQNLKRVCYDQNDIQNWSAHLPSIQLILNSKTHSTTGFSPYELIFGLSTDSRRPPSDLASILSDSEPMTPLLLDLTARTCRKASKASIRSSHTEIPQIAEGTYVLRFNENPGRLHGRWLGPYRVIQSSPDSSKQQLLNLGTNVATYSSVHLCKPFISSSDNPEYYKAIAALDKEEFTIRRMISVNRRKNTAYVEWTCNTKEHVDLGIVKNDSAYSRFMQLPENKKPRVKSN
ncbi:hypothetical protein GEMRC1_009507 [Eukaryota sp. GEM-RC1]